MNRQAHGVIPWKLSAVIPVNCALRDVSRYLVSNVGWVSLMGALEEVEIWTIGNLHGIIVSGTLIKTV